MPKLLSFISFQENDRTVYVSNSQNFPSRRQSTFSYPVHHKKLIHPSISIRAHTFPNIQHPQNHKYATRHLNLLPRPPPSRRSQMERAPSSHSPDVYSTRLRWIIIPFNGQYPSSLHGDRSLRPLEIAIHWRRWKYCGGESRSES